MKIDADKLLERINDLLPAGADIEPDRWTVADDYIWALYHVKNEVSEMIKEAENDRT